MAIVAAALNRLGQMRWHQIRCQVLSLQTLLRYSRMFQYLFRLKRLQLDLEEGWAALKSQRQALRPAHNSAPLWHVRAHMAHYVNNLLLYIQVC